MLVTTTAFLSKTVAFCSSSPSQRVGHQTALCVSQAPPPAVSSRTRVATTTTQCHLPFLRLTAQQCLACARSIHNPAFPTSPPGSPVSLLQELLLSGTISTWLIPLVAPLLNCCVVHFPVTRALVTELLIGFMQTDGPFLAPIEIPGCMG